MNLNQMGFSFMFCAERLQEVNFSTVFENKHKES